MKMNKIQKRHKGLGVVNASPFSMGLFTDKGPPSWHPAGEELKTAAKKVHSLCDEKKKNISKLALCKCLSGENADTVLTGINSMKDLCEALECVGKRYESFDRDLVNGVDEILRGVFNKMW